MALNPFQQGQEFATFQRSRNTENAIQSNRLEGINALADEFGPTALAPAERASVTSGNRAQERLEDEQQEDADARRIAATRGLVKFLKTNIESGVPPEDLIGQIAPLAEQLGFTKDDVASLPEQILNDPNFVNNLDLILQGLQDKTERRAIGQPIPSTTPDGRKVFMQSFNIGPPEEIEGFIPDTELEAGRLAVSQANVVVKQPDVQGAIALERAVGTARGEIIAEDLPPSQRGTANGKLALEAAKQRTTLINRTIDTAIEQADAWTAGFASLTGLLPGTPAANLKATLATIKANIGFAELQRLRDNSKTGGALGQISELENLLLQSVLGAIDESQSPEQLRTNLKALKAQQKLSEARLAEAFEADFGTVYAGPGTVIPGAIRRFNPDTGQLE